MSDRAICTENLSKLYRIGEHRRGYKTLRETIVNTFAAAFRRRRYRPQPSNLNPQSDHIWALKDISLEVNSGEVVGIIGRNGAGKTTLLKILSRITEPTEGWAEIRGRVGSLLEVGTGFHPELTGRENIYLNGAILGMKKAEINRKFDEIVAFADIEKFIDTPVKRYSSGMYVRLAFAVAAHLEPEILLVDEVLAVGDAAFQKKCLGKMGNVAKQGRTVLFVSHNMGAVKSLCNRAVLLDNGRFVKKGHTEEVIAFYLRESTSSDTSISAIWKNSSRLSDELPEVALLSVSLIDLSGTLRNTYTVEETVRVVVDYKVNVAVTGLRIIARFQTSEGIVAFTTYEDSTVIDGRTIFPGEYRAECLIPPNLLNIDTYSILVGIDMPKVKIIIPAMSTVRVQIIDTTSYFRYYRTPQGAVRPKLKWISHTL
ncbi:MAG: ABC transporter ATP-binding protein [Candidatus Thorarchaeota archaeon]|jgi:lipopolysaccharide transport system ATP-binding protein